MFVYQINAESAQPSDGAFRTKYRAEEWRLRADTDGRLRWFCFLVIAHADTNRDIIAICRHHGSGPILNRGLLHNELLTMSDIAILKRQATPEERTKLAIERLLI